MDSTNPNFQQASRLLRLITGQPDAVCDFRAIAETPQRKTEVVARLKKKLPVRFNYRGRLSELFDTLAAKNRNGSAVFYGLNATDGRGRRLANMRFARALALDLDGTPLPDEWQIPPHAIVQSSPGKYQCLWAIKKTKDFAKHRDVMLRLAHRYGGDKSIIDPTRVLRLPGFAHQKQKPFRSRLIRCKDSAKRLPLSAFDWLPPLPTPKKTKRSESGTVPCDLAARYFEHLPAEKFGHDRYRDWLRIGMAMHHATGGEALNEWVTWCASDPEFADDDSQETAAAKWDSFGLERESAVTVGTLVHYGEAYDVPDWIIGELKFGKINAAEDFADDLDLVEAQS